MKKGIAVAGNMLVDTIYTINCYPKIGELALVEDKVTRSTGGAVCNVIADLARLDGKLPLTALGVIGNDENGEFILESLSEYKNIDLSKIVREGASSFSAVMSDRSTKQRTFFHAKGSNAIFSEKHIDWSGLEVSHLHIGYLLLLDELDKPDLEFGTKMARLLASAKKNGIKTSIDMVSDSNSRYEAIVPPALKYTDYCIINETEAQCLTGLRLREENGINEENTLAALRAIRDMGVADWAVIHAPESGYGLDCVSGEFVKLESLCLPEGYIKGTNGAGDAFCAGVLYAAYMEKSLEEALELGTGCAACSLSEPGAAEGMRSYEEVMKLYRNLR